MQHHSLYQNIPWQLFSTRLLIISSNADIFQKYTKKINKEVYFDWKAVLLKSSFKLIYKQRQNIYSVQCVVACHQSFHKLILMTISDYATCSKIKRHLGIFQTHLERTITIRQQNNDISTKNHRWHSFE